MLLLLLSILILLISVSCAGGMLYILFEKKKLIASLTKENEKIEREYSECLELTIKRLSEENTLIGKRLSEEKAESIQKTSEQLEYTTKKLINEKNEALRKLMEDNTRDIELYTRELDFYKTRHEEAEKVIGERDNLLAEARRKVKEEQENLEELKKSYANLLPLQRELQIKINSLKEDESLYELNYYEPHYDFEKALDFERALSDNRKQQKDLLKSGKAVIAYSSIDKKLIVVITKLLLRTFNSECDLLIANVDFKNIVTYENRLNNSFEQLNKLTSAYNISLADGFWALKKEELRICHEFQEKKQAEQEEQRQIKEIMREEIRAERELEKAKAEAEKEEQKYQMLLNRMLEASQNVHGAELEKMNAQIAILQKQLEEAKEKERAISQAQLTKAGHVYIISNIGSFGDSVLKIGMTRRLDPMERINELGDASVPFPFDVHAMIYHENAPELENKLHRLFEHKRINKINYRKEFFRVTLEEIVQAAQNEKADVCVTLIAEAEQYRKTLALEKQLLEQTV